MLNLYSTSIKTWQWTCWGTELNLSKRNTQERGKRCTWQKTLVSLLRGLCPIKTLVIFFEIRSFPLHQSAGKYTSARKGSVVGKQNGYKSKESMGVASCRALLPWAPPFHAAGVAALGLGFWRPSYCLSHQILSSCLKTTLIYWYILWR